MQEYLNHYSEATIQVLWSLLIHNETSKCLVSLIGLSIHFADINIGDKRRYFGACRLARQSTAELEYSIWTASSLGQTIRTFVACQLLHVWWRSTHYFLHILWTLIRIALFARNLHCYAMGKWVNPTIQNNNFHENKSHPNMKNYLYYLIGLVYSDEILIFEFRLKS